MSTKGSFRFVASSRSQPTIVSRLASHQSQPFLSIVRARVLQEHVGEAVMPTSFRSFLSSVPGPPCATGRSPKQLDFALRDAPGFPHLTHRTASLLKSQFMVNLNTKTRHPEKICRY
jgi:hypothetical protein